MALARRNAREKADLWADNFKFARAAEKEDFETADDGNGSMWPLAGFDDEAVDQDWVSIRIAH